MFSYGVRIIDPPYEFYRRDNGEILHPDIKFSSSDAARGFAKGLLMFLDIGESEFDFRLSGTEVQIYDDEFEKFRWVDTDRARQFAEELLMFVGDV